MKNKTNVDGTKGSRTNDIASPTSAAQVCRCLFDNLM